MEIGLLLSDAESRKNVPQYFVGSDFASDGAEVVEGLAEVLGDQVGRGAGGDTGAGEGEGAGGCAEGVEMTRICHQSSRSGIGDTGFLVVGKVT